MIERGPHHRVVNITEPPSPESPNGRVVRYTELAAGMHYWDGTEWRESDADYDLNGPTALAQHTAHRVTLKSNLAEADSVQVITPDGKDFYARPLFLAYRDGTNVALVAEVKDCVGEWVAPGVVVYNDAFDGIEAAVRLTVTQFGFEQDVVLLNQQGLNPATDYGMNVQTATLECWSEVTRAPQAEQVTLAMPNQEQDVLLKFGTMEMRQGSAFTSSGEGPELPVFKRYGVIAGKTYLVESVRSRDFWQLLETLPPPPEANPDDVRVKPRKPLNSDRELLASLKGKSGKKLTTAQFKRGVWDKKKAVVLDYQLVQSNTNNWVFTAGETFLISGPTVFSGATRFEGPCTIKFSKNASASLSISGPVVWDAGPYREIICTARDDDSVGQPISTGTLSGTYATAALNLTGSGQATLMLQYLRVSYAQTAVQGQYFGSANPLTVRHAQFINCAEGFRGQFGTYKIQNVLMTGLGVAFSSYYNATIQAAHLTVNGTPLFHQTSYNPSVSTFVVDNSILNGSSTSGLSYSGTGTSYYYPASTVPLFTAVGGGSHYLPKTSSLRNTGTATLDTTLAADLKLMTTEPPGVLTSDVQVDNELNVSAQRDTDTPDAGFHYSPVDWLVSTLGVAGCNLTLKGGAVVGFTGSAGIWLKPGSSLSSQGLPHRMNVITRYSLVQESPAAGASGGGVVATAIYTGNTGVTLATAPSVDCRFTAFHPGYGSYHLSTSDGVGGTSFYLTKSVLLRDCQFYGGALSLGANTASATVTLNNNLVYRGSVVCGGLMTFSMRNHLNYKTAISVTAPTGNTWVFKDNAFDACTVTQSGAAVTHDYNGYVNASARLTPSAPNDRVIASFAYSTASVGLGPWYHTDATYATGLVDRGSQTWGAAGLAHHTVKTAQTPERLDASSASNALVDGGFHFAAIDVTTGLPMDSDGDGLFDVIEDSNGDGIAGAGESSWTSPNNGLGGGTLFLLFTPLKP